MRSLSDPLPLRSTTGFPTFATAQPLPHVYGVCRIAAIPYSADNRLHFLADHPILSVDAVTVDGKPIKAFQLHNTADASGHPIALLELQDSAESSAIVAEVHGKLNARGAVIANPAEVVYDLLAVAGIAVEEARLLDFRAQTAGIELGGVISDDSASVRSIITDILSSIGAVWTLGAAHIATLCPLFERSAGAPITAVPSLCVADLSSSTRANAITTVLRYEYDQDYAAGKPRAALTLKSETAQRYGEIVKTVRAPMVRNFASALAVATRLLQYGSVPVYRAQVTLAWAWGDEDIAPMDWIATEHHNLPVSVSGEYFVTDSSSAIGGDSYELAIESIPRLLPAVELIGQSSLFEYVKSDLQYEYVDGVLTIAVLNTETDAPLKNASVTILGQEKFTDDKGIVKFRLDHGTYSIKIAAPGFSSFTSELTI